MNAHSNLTRAHGKPGESALTPAPGTPLDLPARIAALEAELARQERLREDSYSVFSEQDTTIARLNAESAQATAKIAELTAELAATNRQMRAESEKALQALETANTERRQADEERSRADALNQRLDEAERTISRLHNERAEYQAIAEALREDDRRAHERQLAAVRAETTRDPGLDQELAALEATLTGAFARLRARIVRQPPAETPPPPAHTGKAVVEAALKARKNLLHDAKGRLAEANETYLPERDELRARLDTLKRTARKLSSADATEANAERRDVEARLTAVERLIDAVRAEVNAHAEACERLERRLDAYHELEEPLPANVLASPMSAEPPLASPQAAHPHGAAEPPSGPQPLSREERAQLFDQIQARHGGAFLFLALLDLVPDREARITAAFTAANRAGLESPIGTENLDKIRLQVESQPIATWVRRCRRTQRNEWVFARTSATLPWDNLERPLFSPDERQRFLAAYANGSG